MNKEETIESLKNAKRVHMEQMDKIDALLLGVKIQNPTPLSKMECAFGEIFYGNSQSFHSILGAQLYEKLDSLHEEWHRDYAKIHALFFQDKKEGLLSKIFGLNKQDPLVYDKAKLYYLELKAITQELLRLLDASLRRVEALSSSKFKS